MDPDSPTPAPPPLPRLLHVVSSFAPAAGGTSEGIRRLAESSIGVCQVELLCLDAPDESYLQGMSFAVHGVGPAQGHYRYTPLLEPWLKQNLHRFDGVVIHGLWQFHGYGTYRVVRGRKPYVVFPHGMLDPYFKKSFPLKHLKKQVYWLAREYRLLRDALAVCFTSPLERDDAVGTMWPEQWHSAVVSFGTTQPAGDPSAQRAAFLARFPALQARTFFLFLARLHTKKGCDLLLRAFAQLAPLHAGMDLVMAGPDDSGLRAPLESLAIELGIADRVHWTGMLDGDIKWGALYAAEAFVLPSHQENFGVAVVEALACGLPVLISNKVNIWPYLVEDQAGLVNPDTVEGTYLGMQTFLAMTREERQAMAARGVACFKARYEMKRTAEALSALFKAL